MEKRPACQIQVSSNPSLSGRLSQMMSDLRSDFSKLVMIPSPCKTEGGDRSVSVGMELTLR